MTKTSFLREHSYPEIKEGSRKGDSHILPDQYAVDDGFLTITVRIKVLKLISI